VYIIGTIENVKGFISANDSYVLLAHDAHFDDSCSISEWKCGSFSHISYKVPSALVPLITILSLAAPSRLFAPSILKMMAGQ
jgi:hypothetical protein